MADEKRDSDAEMMAQVEAEDAASEAWFLGLLAEGRRRDPKATTITGLLKAALPERRITKAEVDADPFIQMVRAIKGGHGDV